MKHHLDFQYGCINGLFSPELALIDLTNPEQLNFVNLDHILDFLVENGIRPILVLDNQISYILKNLEEIQEMSTSRIFSDSDEFNQTIEKILEQ